MKTLPASLAVLLLASSPAFAADHEHGHGGGMMDCPMHDEALSDADRGKRMDELFARLDADANGTIDRAEFDRFHERMRQERMMRDGGDKPAAAPEAKADEHAAHH